MNEVSRKDTGATRVNYDCTYYELLVTRFYFLNRIN